MNKIMLTMTTAPTHTPRILVTIRTLLESMILVKQIGQHSNFYQIWILESRTDCRTVQLYLIANVMGGSILFLKTSAMELS
jgi:hypothetical protein